MKTKAVITWCAEDIKNQCDTLTDKQIGDVLSLIENNHDATIGVNWEVINHYIKEVIKESKMKRVKLGIKKYEYEIGEDWDDKTFINCIGYYYIEDNTLLFSYDTERNKMVTDNDIEVSDLTALKVWEYNDLVKEIRKHHPNFLIKELEGRYI